jgi:hypothetical protein
MNAVVRFVEFGEEVTASVSDSAAPVIVSARYAPGAMLSETDVSRDTLLVEFSEDIASVSAARPFALFNVSQGVQYYVVTGNNSIAGATGSFYVDSIGIVELPANNDSIWIDSAGGVADINGIVQTNPQNRRVLMNVKAAPYSLTVKIVPNPFIPGNSPLPRELLNALPGARIENGVAVEVAVLSKVETKTSITAKAVIYDAVGNVVIHCDENSSESAQILSDAKNGRTWLLWNGANRQGRYVGPGTYLAIIATEDSAGHIERTRRKIGVARPR